MGAGVLRRCARDNVLSNKMVCTANATVFEVAYATLADDNVNSYAIALKDGSEDCYDLRMRIGLKGRGW